MTKSNDGWVPEVGQECEYQHIGGWSWCIYHGKTVDGKCIVENEYTVFTDPDMLGGFNFRQIKTEAEKRRESMLEDMVFNVPRYEYEHLHVVENIVNHTCSALIDAGWIKPKPLTEDVICQIHGNLSESQFRTFATRIEAYIRGEMP